MITAQQIRAAKAILRWAGERLAHESGLSLSTIRRVELGDGVPEAQSVKTLIAIRQALEAAGIEFIGTPEDGPGVRIKGSEGGA